VNILIVAATKNELSFEAGDIHSLLNDTSKNTYEILVTGPGMLSTSFYLTRQLAAKRYDLVINAGIAGSLHSPLTIGEVVQVVSEQLADIGAEDGSRFLDLFDLGLVQESSFPFTGKLLIPAPYSTPSLKLLPKVAGLTVNKAHGHAESIEALKAYSHAQVETMEGAACFYTCMLMQTSVIQIRAISNMVEPRNKNNWNIPLAVTNLNQSLLKLLNEL
jgi:futalosine hydrolase